MPIAAPSSIAESPIPPVAAAAAPIHVYRVARECVSLVWPQVAPLLAKALPLEHGRFTIHHIYGWVKSGDQQLWVITCDGRYLAAFLVRLDIHPTGKRVSTAHFLGGQGVREWGRLLFEHWLEQCRLEGVTEMCVVGRRGWYRFAKPFGFKQEAVILRHEEAL